MTRLNPLKILLGWTVLILILTPILMYISSLSSSGGELKPVSTLFSMLYITLFGATLICLLTPFFFKNWLTGNKWFIVLTILFLMSSSILFWQSNFATPYSFEEKYHEINGDKWEIRTEYYDYKNNVVRSKSFWKNGKKDSIWKVYAKDGSLLTEHFFKKDSLVKRP